MARSLALFVVLGAAATAAGCVLHDWSGYASGLVGDDAGAGPAEGGSPAPDGSAARVDAGALDPYGAVVQADGPLAWYRFEEAIGATSVADVAGRYPARVQTSAYFGATGVAGRGVTLDGSGGFDPGDVFDFAGMAAFTLEAWVRTKNVYVDQSIMTKRDDSAQPGPLGYVFYLAGDLTPHFEGWGFATSAWTATPIKVDTFTHIVVTVTSADGKLFASLWTNGQLAENGGFETTDNVPNTAVHFGLCSTIRGTVDEVALYDKALPHPRILAHYLAGSGGS